MEQALTTCWLIDAGALRPDELAVLRQASDVHFVYAGLGEPEAETLGPVLVAAQSNVDGLVDALQSDLQRCWAVAELSFGGGWRAMIRHVTVHRFIRTQDKARYFLRYADARCWAVVWRLLTARQKRALMGPIESWRHLDRDGHWQTLDMRDAWTVSNDAVVQGLEVRLDDGQLARLLEAVWPDQLLSSVLEDQPHLRGRGTPSWLHAMSSMVCEWCRQQEEERFPVQKACLATVLQHEGRAPPDRAQVFKELGDIFKDESNA